MDRIRTEIEKRLFDKGLVFGRALVRIKTKIETTFFGTALVRIRAKIEKNTLFWQGFG